MAITLRVASASWTELTADGAVAIPATPTVGDRMFLFAAWKDYAITATVSGWTEIAEWADGTVDAANNVGSVKVACWYKDYAAAGNPTIDFSASPTNAQAAMLVMAPGAGETFTTPAYVTAALSWTTGATTTDASSTVTVPSGGVVMAICGIRDDTATFTRGNDALDDNAAGVTWNGNYVESPATHASSTTGQDLAADLGYRLVTTGAAAQTLTVTGTLSAAETGAALWIVQGIIVNTNAPAGVATATASSKVPIPKVDPNGGLAVVTGSGKAATFSPHVDVAAGLATATASATAAGPTVGGVAAKPDAPAAALGGSSKISGWAAPAEATAAGAAGIGTVGAQAGLASATATAPAATWTVGGVVLTWGPWSQTWDNLVPAFADAGTATATAAGLLASASIKANAATATASAAGLLASASIKPSAGTTAATASGKAVIPNIGGVAGQAQATAVAPAVTATLVCRAPAGHPGYPAAAARQPRAAIKVNAGLASATAAANAPVGKTGALAARAQATAAAYAATKKVAPNAGLVTATASGKSILWSAVDNILVWAALASATATANRVYQGGTGGKPPRGIAATDTARLVVSPPRPSLDVTTPRGRGTAGGPRPKGRAEVDIPRG